MSGDPVNTLAADVYYLKKSSNQSVVYTSVEGIMEPAKTLIDSGSSKNFIDKSYVAGHKLPTTSLARKVSIVAIDGKEIDEVISEKVEANIEVEGKTLPCNLYVMDLHQQNQFFSCSASTLLFTISHYFRYNHATNRYAIYHSSASCSVVATE